MEYCRREDETIRHQPEESNGSISTHGGDVEASTVAEVLEQLLHEQYLHVDTTVCHTRLPKRLIAVCQCGKQRED